VAKNKSRRFRDQVLVKHQKWQFSLSKKDNPFVTFDKGEISASNSVKISSVNADVFTFHKFQNHKKHSIGIWNLKNLEFYKTLDPQIQYIRYFNRNIILKSWQLIWPISIETS
jgi:hypothetical protein